MSATDKCEWVQTEGGWHETACGNAFEVNDGDLSKHRIKFCPFCGKEIKELPYKEKEEE